MKKKIIFILILVINIFCVAGEKVYPIHAYDYNQNIKSFRPYASLVDEKFFTGLYAPTGASCSSFTNCELIDGKYETSCVLYDFGKSYSSPISVKYTKTDLSINGDSCTTFCGTFPGLHVFTSVDNKTWVFKASLEDTLSNVYQTRTVSAPGSYRYVAACRAGAGHGADNLKIAYVHTEGTEYQDVYNYYREYYLKNKITATISSYRNDQDGPSFNGLSVQCNILASSYKLTNNISLKNKAIEIGEFLIANKDLNNNGVVGWGVQPNYVDERDRSICSPSQLDVLRCYGNPGETDAFGDCTCNPQNAEFIFQTARAMRCLSDLYEITKDTRYLAVAEQAATDSWYNGTATIPGCSNCFYYWYSPHPNDYRRYVRNTNIEMGAAIAQLYSLTGKEKYKLRALQTINAELFEVNNGNKGYFGVMDPKYVSNPIKESKRVEDHLPSQAFYGYEIGRYLNIDYNTSYVLKVMQDWENCGDFCDANFCCTNYTCAPTSYTSAGKECSWSGDAEISTNSASFYYCFVRDISKELKLNCLHEMNDLGNSYFSWWFAAWSFTNNFEKDNDNDNWFVKDCDDINPNINPGATETCDGKDNNCNSQIDENCNTDLCRADLNNDRMINSADLNLIAINFGKTTGFDQKTDVNNDGRINIHDWVYIARRFGASLFTC